MNLFSDITSPSVPWYTALLFAVLLLVQLGLAVRVIMRRLSVGESLAWIMVLFLLPVGGVLVYLLIGELRLGNRRVQRLLSLNDAIRRWLGQLHDRYRVEWSHPGVSFEPLAKLAELTIGLPALPGNRLVLIDDWNEVFARLIEDIDAARRTCHLEFYIWHVGGKADDVAEALIRAARRGVICRVLIDAIGSRPFLRSKLAGRMREENIQIQDALPGGFLRMPFVRFDLRLHRKIVVIDGRVAYTGSLNLVDPRYFKRDAGVGQWIDAMCRFEGPAVEAMAITFLTDWYVETDAELDHLQQTGDAAPQSRQGDTAVQVMPSGPAHASDAIEQIVIMAAYAARQELIITTPYFVPNESLLMALMSAARRGVKVILIVPGRVDSWLVRFASQAFKGELLEAGVRIALFQGGLLHTKSITVDGEFSLFGSLNLDPRSLFLNFEISLGIYDAVFTRELRALQQSYLDQSELMDVTTYHARRGVQRFTENLARLLGPLL